MKIPPEQIQEIDVPEVLEQFSDSLGMSMMDNSGMRLTFCIRRMQPPVPPKPPMFKQFPVSRIVLTHEAMVDLFNQLNQMMGQLQKTGAVKIEPGKPVEAIEKGKVNPTPKRAK